MIGQITIVRHGDLAYVTFIDEERQTFIVSDVAGDIQAITDAIAKELHADALKAAFEEYGIEILRGMSTDNFNGELADIVADVFPNHDDNPAGQYGDLIDLAHTVFEKLGA